MAIQALSAKIGGMTMRLLCQPSKGHPCRILIIFPYCSTISLAPHIKKFETYFALLYFWTFAQCGSTVKVD